MGESRVQGSAESAVGSAMKRTVYKAGRGVRSGDMCGSVA